VREMVGKMGKSLIYRGIGGREEKEGVSMNGYHFLLLLKNQRKTPQYKLHSLF
jgi:hypothetical protein